MVGPGMDHIGHLLVLALIHGETASSLLDMPFYHPTLEEGLKSGLREICQAAHSSLRGDRDQGLRPELEGSVSGPRRGVAGWVERSEAQRGCQIQQWKRLRRFPRYGFARGTLIQALSQGGRGQSSAGACVEWITAQPYPRATEIPPSKKPRRNHPRGFCYRQKVIRP